MPRRTVRDLSLHQSANNKKRHRLTRKGSAFLLTLVFCVSCTTLVFPISILEFSKKRVGKVVPGDASLVLNSSAVSFLKPRRENCTYHTCVDVTQCQVGESDHVLVYIYPEMAVFDEHSNQVTMPPLHQFKDMLQGLRELPFITNDPDEACLFIPNINTLNQNSLNLKRTSIVLHLLPQWRGSGQNHVIFNMIPGEAPDYNTTIDLHTNQAILAGAGFHSTSYRVGVDVSIPLVNPYVMMREPTKANRNYLLVSAQRNILEEDLAVLKSLAKNSNDFLLAKQHCNISGDVIKPEQDCYHQAYWYKHLSTLQMADFCLVLRTSRLAQTELYDAMKAGCIPVIVANGYVLPFSEVLDWTRFSVRVAEEKLSEILVLLRDIPQHQRQSMSEQVHYVFSTYMSTFQKVAVTTLKIISDRILRHKALTYEQWNNPRGKTRETSLPFFLPITPPKHDGFTAVILTYDRQQCLFDLVKLLIQVKSLVKIVVVWNNQDTTPPEEKLWPNTGNISLVVLQSRENKLSSRFYPYNDIQTEGILAIDDDITMFSADELEFGFQVWREHPDRLVGYPSRLHLWDKHSSTWKYTADWTAAISFVLTGAAFHHKYYSYMYTYHMPGDIKDYVDSCMNCEDVAMNFLITNLTNKAPIKVVPRQKFKATSCPSGKDLSHDANHLYTRSECIAHFKTHYGMLPLKYIEFRADPVLYKINVSETVAKRTYQNIGEL